MKPRSSGSGGGSGMDAAMLKRLCNSFSCNRQWLMLVSQGIDYIAVDINSVGKHFGVFSCVHKFLIISLEVSTF